MSIWNIFQVSQELWSNHPSKLGYISSGQEDKYPDDRAGQFAFRGILRQMHQAIYGFTNPKNGNKIEGTEARLATAEERHNKALEGDPDRTSIEVSNSQATVNNAMALHFALLREYEEGVSVFNSIYSEEFSPDLIQTGPVAPKEVLDEAATKRAELMASLGIEMPSTGTEG